MKFLKAHWPLLLCIAAGLVFFAWAQTWGSSDDEAIAQMMADKVMAQHRAQFQKQKQIYRDKLAAKDKVIKIKDGRVDDVLGVADANAKLAASRLAEIRKMKDCEKRAAAFDAELSNRAVMELNFRQFIRTAVGELVFAYSDKSTLQAARILELEEAINGTMNADGKLVKGGYIQEIGDLVKQNVILKLKARRKLIIGPQVGYNLVTKEGYVGLGATFEVFRVKAPF